MLILISDAFGPDLPDQLAKFGEVTDDQGRLGEAEVVLIRSKTKCRDDWWEKAPNVKLIIRGGVGLDNVDLVYAKEHGVDVRNTPDASTTAVAELAFAMMIALPNHIAVADASMRRGEWIKKQLKRGELHSKTLGVLGLGRIGLALAQRAKAFTMDVVGWHPDSYFTDWAEILPTMEEVLSRSDFVSMHMPLTDGTKGLINKDTLRHFKDGAYLINTARGKIVVEEDIVEALKTGKLAGYATDVWYSDPPVDSPLMDAPNTLFLPHLGASSRENMGRIAIIVERIIGDHVARKG
ncbi:MAG: NAD(P)-dependent oxidoreductase [Planctomycetota bacterium]